MGAENGYSSPGFTLARKVPVSGSAAISIVSQPIRGSAGSSTNVHRKRDSPTANRISRGASPRTASGESTSPVRSASV